MKKICVLLNGPVRHDGRVIKTIDSLSQRLMVDLYYVRGEAEDSKLFNENVRLYPMPFHYGWTQKLIRHTFFYNEFNFLAAAVLNTGNQYDYVYSNDLPTLNPGVRIARALSAKLIYDSHEIYTETINQFFPRHEKGWKGMLFQSLIRFMRRSGQKKEDQLLKHVDQFITVNASLADYFKRTYGDRQIDVMMNCPILDGNSIEPAVNYRKKYNWKTDDTILYYHGAFSEGRGLNLLIDTMSRLNDSYKLVIIGYGVLKEQMQRQVNRLQLMDRIKFFGKVPNQDLLGYVLSADIGILLLDQFNKSKAMASPNKLFEYIHAGIPFICSDTAENRKVIETFKVGTLVKNEQKDIIAGIKIIKTLRDRPFFEEEVMKAKQFYNWSKQSEILEKIQ